MLNTQTGLPRVSCCKVSRHPKMTWREHSAQSGLLASLVPSAIGTGQFDKHRRTVAVRRVTLNGSAGRPLTSASIASGVSSAQKKPSTSWRKGDPDSRAWTASLIRLATLPGTPKFPGSNERFIREINRIAELRAESF